MSPSASLSLPKTPWVKFVRFVAQGEPNTSYQCPGDIVVLEQQNSNSYLSILAGWGEHSSQGPYEATQNKADTAYSPTGGASKEEARAIGGQETVISSVKRERNEDWFIIRKESD